MQVMGMVAVSCAPRRDELDGSGTVSGRINNPGKLTFPFPAKTVVAVYPMRNCCACPLLSLCPLPVLCLSFAFLSKVKSLSERD